MKKLLLIAAAWGLLNSCNQSASTSPSATDSSKSTTSNKQSKEERNRAIVKASWEASEKADIDGTLRDVAPDAVDYGDGTMGTLKGVDSIRAMMQKMMPAWKAAFPDSKTSNAMFLASGDTVLVWGAFSGTWKGEFMKQKPTGKSFKFYGANYFLLNDAGKITEHRASPGDLEMAKAVGMKM